MLCDRCYLGIRVEYEMKPAAVKPENAEDLNDTVDENPTVVKRSGRLSAAKRKSLDVTTAADGTGEQPKENAKKRQRRTRSAGIAEIEKPLPEGASGIEGAAAEKKRKVTTKTGSLTGTTAGNETTTAAKSSSSSKPRKTACRKRKTTSGATAATAGKGDGDVARAAACRPDTNDKRTAGKPPQETETGDAGPEPTGEAAHPPGNTFERDVMLLSKRVGVPRDELARAIESDAIPVFRRRFSGLFTPDMMTVSPVVYTRSSGAPGTGPVRKRGCVGYGVEPARCSAACGAASLKHLMDELTKTMPSWVLHVVAEPRPWYVISRMTVDAYGTPAVDRSVVLDGQLRASVYVDGRLDYVHCKRYGTATEIVNLINELNGIVSTDDDDV